MRSSKDTVKWYVDVDLLLQFPEYSFQVFPVHNCPMNKEAWDKSSDRLKCNRTHGYHCVPNSQLTSLIEFCYPRGEKILFQEGIIIVLRILVWEYKNAIQNRFIYHRTGMYLKNHNIHSLIHVWVIWTIIYFFE